MPARRATPLATVGESGLQALLCQPVVRREDHLLNDPTSFMPHRRKHNCDALGEGGFPEESGKPYTYANMARTDTGGELFSTVWLMR
jgi:hypothetical protein